MALRFISHKTVNKIRNVIIVEDKIEYSKEFKHKISH